MAEAVVGGPAGPLFLRRMQT